MKQAEQALTTVTHEGGIYRGSSDGDITTIHFTSSVCCIYFEDGSSVVIDTHTEDQKLHYRVAGGPSVEVTP